MSRYGPIVYVLPEDDANRQMANGFVLHHEVDERRIKVLPPPGGWRRVLETFLLEYPTVLRNNPRAYVVLLIDFDDQVESRKSQFRQSFESLPQNCRSRVFLIGSSGEPERLKQALKRSFEKLGEGLADDCRSGLTSIRNHEDVRLNEAEFQRLREQVGDFLFREG